MDGCIPAPQPGDKLKTFRGEPCTFVEWDDHRPYKVVVTMDHDGLKRVFYASVVGVCDPRMSDKPQIVKDMIEVRA